LGATQIPKKSKTESNQNLSRTIREPPWPPFSAAENWIVVAKSKRRPRCIVIAGPNGARKTSFAREYLVQQANVVHFVNADLIAAGLSPLSPGLAPLAAARTVLREIDRLVVAREDFAFESTLSGLNYGRRMQR